MLEPDQKILVSGNVYDAQNNSDYSISRYNTNGSPDSTFGTNGTTITKFVQGSSLYVNGVAIANNEFIAVGSGDDPLSIGILAEYHLGNQTITTDTPAVAVVAAKTVIESGLTITAAPNPTTSTFSIHLSSSTETSSVTLQLMNDQGMALQTINNLFPGQTINIGGSLHPGIYFLKVINGNSAKTIKLVKL